MQVGNSNSYDDATGVIVDIHIGNGFDYKGSNTQGVGTTTYNPTTRTITWNIGFMPKGGIAFMKIYTKAIESGTYTTHQTQHSKTNISRPNRCKTAQTTKQTIHNRTTSSRHTSKPKLHNKHTKHSPIRNIHHNSKQQRTRHTPQEYK